MPRAPKQCAQAACSTRVIGKPYCDDHTPMNWKGERRTTTAAHKAWAMAVLKRDNFICQIKLRGCTTKATQADHILNVKRGGAEHDINNGQAACTTCHKQKTQQESLTARRGWRGTPPPGSSALP